MPFRESDLGGLGSLTHAIGLTDGTGTNAKWFDDPVGGSATNPNGLQTILSDEGQRRALEQFVDETLGPPEGHDEGQARWVPLFREDSVDLTVYAVLEPTGAAGNGTVQVGIGLEYSRESSTAPHPRVSLRLHVPFVQVPRGTSYPSAAVSDASLPHWLLLGRPGGRIGIEVAATFTDAAPVPREAFLRGARVEVGIPTCADDTFEFTLELTDLQLPGATTPSSRTLTLDDLATAGQDLLEFLAGLVRAQVATLDTTDPVMRHVVGLAGALGLRPVADIPELPLTDLPTRGTAALVEWVESVLTTPAARTAFWQQIGLLAGPGWTVDPVAGTLSHAIGPVTATAGLQVTPGTGGHPVLVPTVELGLATRSGVEARAVVDVLCVDTGTGTVTAVPSLRAEVVVGADAGGPPLLGGTPRIGSVHLGIGLDAHRRPAFLLSLHDVDLTGSQHADVLDLSSPQAVLDAGTNALRTAITAWLTALGEPGQLLGELLGIDPPAGVAGIDLVGLGRDPIAELRGYWDRVSGDASMADVLGRLRRLLFGTAAAAVPGDGTAEEPWLLDLGAGAALTVWRDGDVLAVGFQLAADLDVLDDLAAAAGLHATLLTVDLTTGRCAFVAAVTGSVGLGSRTDDSVRRSLGPVTLALRAVTVVVDWSPGLGLHVRPDAVGLEVTVAGAGLGQEVFALPLPTVDAQGRWSFDPDWSAVERVLGHLGRSLDLPALTAALDLLGWGVTDTAVAHLGLDDLVADAAAALQAWALDALLDCEHLAGVMAPVAWMLSGGALDRALGSGHPLQPWRAPVGGDPAALALTVHTLPGCPPSATLRPETTSALFALTGDTAATAEQIASALTEAAVDLPDVAELVHARVGLADGLVTLVDRWVGSDGLVTVPATTDAGGRLHLSADSGVDVRVLPGFTYATLAASARVGGLALPRLPGMPAAVVHVDTDPAAHRAAPAAARIDLTAPAPGAVPAAGDGPWYLLLPDATSAAALRTDHDPVRAQADLLAVALAGRAAPVVLVGHDAAGAAAVHATSLGSTATVATHVVTVGTPWGTVSATSLAIGLGGDAFRLLRTFVPDPSPVLPSANPVDAPVVPDEVLALGGSALHQGIALVRRGEAGLRTTTAAPSPLGLARGAGVQVHAVFGTLDEAAVRLALGALVSEGVEARRLALAEAPSGAPVSAVAGLDLPAVDVILGGIAVGASAHLDLLTARRTAPVLTPQRTLTLDLRLAVSDSWLVGGPGASQNDLEVRWVDVRLTLPFDGTPGHTELVLHEARAHTAYRERWVVSGDATGATPEIRILLGEVVARVKAQPGLAELLTALGLLRNGGLDPTGLDHLLYDPVTTVVGAARTAPAQVAAALRTLLPSVTGSPLGGTQVRLGGEAASATLDLATGTLTATVDLGPLGVPFSAALQARMTPDDPARPPHVELTGTLGTFSPTGSGLRLVGHAGSSGASLAVEHGIPGGVVRTVALWPAADPDALRDLLVPGVPAALLTILIRVLRDEVSDPALDASLSALGLLGPVLPEQPRAVVVPFTLLSDPVAWLRNEVDPNAAVVAALDALARIVTPTRGADPGWPIAPGIRLAYAVVADRLEVAVAVDVAATLGTHHVTGSVSGGLSLGRSGAPGVLVDTRVAVDGYGLELLVDPAAPVPVRLDLLRPAPAASVSLVPPGPGLAAAVLQSATALVGPALDELMSHRTGAAGLAKDVAVVVHDVALALDLLDPAGTHVDAAKLAAWAAPPGPGTLLLSRLPALAATGLAALADLLDPAHGLVATSVTGTLRRFEIGALPAGPGAVRPVFVAIDGSSTAPAFVLGCDVALGDVGRLVVEGIRIDAVGVQVSAQGGPFTIDLGTVVLRPLVAVRAGITSSSFTPMVGLGIAVESGPAAASVQLRWSEGSVGLWSVTPGTTPVETEDPAQVAAGLFGVALSVVVGVVADGLGPLMTARLTRMLQGVVLTGGAVQVDPDLVRDLAAVVDHPELLLHRVQRLAWNCATDPQPPSVTFGGVVTVALAADGTDPGPRDLGVRVSIPAGMAWDLGSSDPRIEIVAHADWITGTPPSGLSIFLLHGTRDDLTIVPGILVAGLGVRVAGASTPLIDLSGFSIDAIEVDVYGEATASTTGGGVRLKLDGLAVAPGGGGGTNPMANSIMSDVGASSGNNRPTFAPSIAVQQHGSADPTLTLRAGDPPGPWWLVIQRQLGPLYVDRIGLDTTEADGTVVAVSLLFTGELSLFGFTAAVDRLSIGWTGGDPLDSRHWAVDLMGLAISADMAGASLAGGLLKVVDPVTHETGYLGMLVGRFAAYGLSVFGGYSQDEHGNASFFVFGGVNGPFGGPPAFFLTGIGGGLGINRGLVVPSDISRFGDFPFIAALDASRAPQEPMQQLQSLRAVFPHSPGQFWFAAGISFTSFNLVDGIAVLAVSFGDGLDINLFGFARMALPRPDACIVSIELALLAHFSTEEGVFLIQAQLTDNSWLLYPEVRLTGGFAFAVWWKGPLAGQFVLTLGGYHPHFEIPAGYPDVPRLGLVWQVSSFLVIKGGAYFALTSEALMAGMGIEVSLDLGWVWAKLAFGADAIVWFDPFWLEASAYARISAGISIKLPWPIGRISLSVTLSATVELWGPDFAGHAELEVGPCTVPVDFGSTRKQRPEKIDWAGFVTKYLEGTGTNAARALSAITGRGTLPTSTTSATGAPTADGSRDLPFQVYAEFELTITTTVPATSMGSATGARTSATVTPSRSSGAPTALGVAPMGADQLASPLGVTLERKDAGGWVPAAASLDLLTANLGKGAAADPAGSRVGTESFPLGVWGPAKTLGTAASLPSTEVVRAANRLTLVAQVVANPVGPLIDSRRYDHDRQPLPLHATNATRGKLLAAAPSLPVAASADDALAIAADVLFPTTAGLGAPHRHSDLARAAYRRDRVAPPRFATLTEGLAKVNGTSGERSPLETREQAVPGIRRPYVGALLTSGVGAALRAATTTVSDGALKRRPAPTTDSVLARFVRQLPVNLTLTPATAAVRRGTVVASGAVPRTDAAGTTRSYGGARVGSPELTGLVAGLGVRAGLAGPAPRRGSRAAAADAVVTPLRSGDLVVLEHPDAAIDVDPERRPSLTVDGSARVVVVVGRRVVLDEAVSTALPVPPGTGLLAVHADGGALGPGSPGWVRSSRVARLGSQVALAAGCTIIAETLSSAPTRRWAPASELVADAAEVTTWFATPVRTVAVALTGAAPTSDVPLDLSFTGAHRRTHRDGTPLPPTAVTLGDTTVLLYDLVPGEQGPVGVTVRDGGPWTLAGVLGTDEAPPAYGERLARDGMEATLAKVLATSGPGVTLGWVDAPPPPRRRAPRRPR